MYKRNTRQQAAEHVKTSEPGALNLAPSSGEGGSVAADVNIQMPAVGEASATKAGARTAPEATRSPGKSHADGVSAASGAAATGAPSQEDSELAEQARQSQEAHRRIQRQRRTLLAACEPLLLVNHNALSMPDYPDNEQVEMARRRRDLWLLLCLFLFAVLVLGLFNFANPILAGVACGGLAFALSLIIPQVRDLIMRVPSYRELMDSRRQQELKALNHVRSLEGKQGLARHFVGLQEYNRALRNLNYQRLMQISAKGALLSVLRTPALLRLYDQMLAEAEIAYERLREAYLEGERQALDPTAAD